MHGTPKHGNSTMEPPHVGTASTTECYVASFMWICSLNPRCAPRRREISAPRARAGCLLNVPAMMPLWQRGAGGPTADPCSNRPRASPRLRRASEIQCAKSPHAVGSQKTANDTEHLSLLSAACLAHLTPVARRSPLVFSIGRVRAPKGTHVGHMARTWEQPPSQAEPGFRSCLCQFLAV